MVWLCEGLEYAADNGYDIKLNEASDRYVALAEKAEIKIPRSFISRRSTFKCKLLLSLGNVMDCIQCFEGRPPERLSLLIHTEYISIAVSKLANESADTDDFLTMPTYEQHKDIFSFSGSCCIEATRVLGLKGLSVSEQDAIDSLCMFLWLLFGGKKLLHGETG